MMGEALDLGLYEKNRLCDSVFDEKSFVLSLFCIYAEKVCSKTVEMKEKRGRE